MPSRTLDVMKVMIGKDLCWADQISIFRFWLLLNLSKTQKIKPVFAGVYYC